MKIALCLAGQFRTFDTELVHKSLKHFFVDKYKCDVFMSTWAHRGISYSHGNVFADRIPLKTDTITEELIKSYLPIKGVEIEDFNVWVKSLNPDQQNFVLRGGIHHRGCLPQLYKKKKVIELINSLGCKYDYIILTRPDMFLWRHLDVEDLQQPNTVYNINLPKTFSYFPNRIYDIFMMGENNVMQKMAQTYDFVESLLDDPYNSTLHSHDCCKMLYIYAKKFCNFNIDTTPSIPGDVFRGNIQEELAYFSTNANLNKDWLVSTLQLNLT